MNAITSHVALPPATPEMLDAVNELQARVMQAEQVPIRTHHMFHAGLYARTILIPAGTVLVGALIKIPTLLIVQGDAEVNGQGRITGYAILPGSAGRKQVYVTYQDTHVTMVFPTNAKTVEEAEREFTDEFELLMSHEHQNDIVITGE